MKLQLWLVVVAAVLTMTSSSRKPDPERVPAFARWLVERSTWGVLSTIDSDNAPFGNVMSYSVGPTGTPYFFLTTTLDPTGKNALENSKSSLAVSEYPLGSCNQLDDPQSPTCSKITLNGKLSLVKQNSAEEASARELLFADHPRLGGWPAIKGNGFRVFKLDVGSVFLVNAQKPPRNISVAQYLSA